MIPQLEAVWLSIKTSVSLLATAMVLAFVAWAFWQSHELHVLREQIKTADAIMRTKIAQTAPVVVKTVVEYKDKYIIQPAKKKEKNLEIIYTDERKNPVVSCLPNQSWADVHIPDNVVNVLRNDNQGSANNATRRPAETNAGTSITDERLANWAVELQSALRQCNADKQGIRDFYARLN